MAISEKNEISEEIEKFCGWLQTATAKERRDERGNERFAKCLKKSHSKALKGLNNDFVAVDISGG